MADTIVLSGAVEGLLDEAVLRRLVEQEGAILKPLYGKTGKSNLRKQINGYNQAARFFPWIVLVDLDRDNDCAPDLKAEWLPEPAHHMCFRVAVRAVEAWLLADREPLARFLSVSTSRLPFHPETLDDPKHDMIELARRSRRREIREGMVPRPGSGRKVGSAYTSQMIEFVQTRWRPAVAARRSNSLRRCRERIHELVRGGGDIGIPEEIK